MKDFFHLQAGFNNHKHQQTDSLKIQTISSTFKKEKQGKTGVYFTSSSIAGIFILYSFPEKYIIL